MLRMACEAVRKQSQVLCPVVNHVKGGIKDQFLNCLTFFVTAQMVKKANSHWANTTPRQCSLIKIIKIKWKSINIKVTVPQYSYGEKKCHSVVTWINFLCWMCSSRAFWQLKQHKHAKYSHCVFLYCINICNNNVCHFFNSTHWNLSVKDHISSLVTLNVLHIVIIKILLPIYLPTDIHSIFGDIRLRKVWKPMWPWRPLKITDKASSVIFYQSLIAITFQTVQFPDTHCNICRVLCQDLSIKTGRRS